MKAIPRRRILAASAVLGGRTVLGLGETQQQVAEEGEKPDSKLKVLVVGGHPDDPETGCGGTMARYASEGHDVVAVYLTRGEHGIKGKSPEETARIRTGEARAACRILGARPVFVGQTCSHTEITNDRYEEFKKIVLTEAPDLLFAHWPIDSHRDHRAASTLSLDAWLGLDKRFALYYYEVYSGIQTQNFSPTHYVDITATEPQKKSATYAHASQDPERLYKLHDLMNRFRGTEYRCRYAEGFVRHIQGPNDALRF